jgi:hypothetical protein
MNNKEKILKICEDIKRKPKKWALDYLITELIKLVELEFNNN